MASPSWLATQPPTPITRSGLELLQVAHPAEVVEHLLLRLFAHRAGVEQDDVGFLGIVGLDRALAAGQDVGHLVRVVLVHLAAEGADEDFLGHWCGKGVGEGRIIRPGFATIRRMKPAVVLLSGGLDSATVLALAREQGFACHCLSLDYGQRHGAELQAAARVAKLRWAPPRIAC
jgi:hypothetical protein